MATRKARRRNIQRHQKKPNEVNWNSRGASMATLCCTSFEEQNGVLCFSVLAMRCLLHHLPAASCSVVQVTAGSGISCGGLIERRGHCTRTSGKCATRTAWTCEFRHEPRYQSPHCTTSILSLRNRHTNSVSVWEKVTTVLAWTVRGPTPQPGSLQGLCRCSTKGLGTMSGCRALRGVPNRFTTAAARTSRTA